MRRVWVLVLTVALVFFVGGAAAYAGWFQDKTVTLPGFTYVGDLIIPTIGLTEDGTHIHVFDDSQRKCYIYFLQGQWTIPAIAVLPYGETPAPEGEK